MDWLLKAPNTLLGRAADRGIPSTLTAFYRSGAILAHYSTDRVLRDAAGAITAFPNMGGAGSVLDATVIGPELMQQFSTAIFPENGTSITQIAAPLNLIGVRLFWLMDTAQAADGARLFGRQDVSGIVMAKNASGMELQIRRAGVGPNLAPRTPWPEGLAVYELDATATTYTLRINGVVVASAAHTHADLLIDRIASGQAGLLRFAGRMGEILGVILGLTDTGAAITAARARLNARLLEITPIASGAAIAGLPAVPAVAVTPTFDGAIIGAS
ncbi:hypothetical protein [Paracoccus sp. NSM]|uniref:hypothetical protein n=1 Tax=Paracoccus sp. NSM TaxID=3457784 RepID=UPI004035A0CC